MPQIDKQGNAILVQLRAGSGFSVNVCERSSSTQQLSIQDISVTADTVWASIMSPNGVGFVVWCTPDVNASMKSVIISKPENKYVVGSTIIITSAMYHFQNINSIRLATNRQNTVMAVWNIPFQSEEMGDVAQYAVFNNGAWSSVQSLFHLKDIGSFNSSGVPMVALDNDGNALFAMSYYDNSSVLQNTLVAKYLSAGTLGSLQTYSNSNIKPMALTSVQYVKNTGLYCIVSNTLSSTSDFTTQAPATVLDQVLDNKINNTFGYISAANPIFTNLYKNNDDLILNLRFTQGQEVIVQNYYNISSSSGYTTSWLLSDPISLMSSLIYGASGAPYCGFLNPGSLISTVLNLETNQVAFNQQIADFTPTNSQISINESGMVVVFYTDASGDVYTYRTTVGSSNPLVDAVKNYSRLKPQQGLL